MTAVLRAQDLQTFYGKSHILHGISLEVNEGEIVAVLGRNGAGKTTTVRSLVGLTPPRQGKVEIFGKDTTRWPAHRIAGLGVGYVPEGRKIFGPLTVLENLKVPQARPGPWDLERVWKLFPRLAERKAQLGRQLSGGEQEMLSIADRAYILDDGKVVYSGKAADLAQDTELVNKLAGAGSKGASAAGLPRH